MYKETIKTAGEKMDKTLSVIQKDLSTLRAGRANPQILDKITVDYYGTPTPLNQVGNISSPEPRMLVIAPWEPKMIGPIEKAIQIEEGKVAIRAIRRDAMESIKKMKKDSVITEDDQKVAENELQKVTDSHIKDIDRIGADKEKEIMAV